MNINSYFTLIGNSDGTHSETSIARNIFNALLKNHHNDPDIYDRAVKEWGDFINELNKYVPNDDSYIQQVEINSDANAHAILDIIGNYITKVEGEFFIGNPDLNSAELITDASKAYEALTLYEILEISPEKANSITAGEIIRTVK